MRKTYVVLLSVLLVLLILTSTWGVKRYRNRFGNQLLKKAQAGDSTAQFELAKLYADGQKNFPKDNGAAFEWYSRAAVQGNAKAQNNLGLMYATGVGATKNDVTAFQWFEKSAAQGDVKAEGHLASSYLLGHGVPQNYLESVKWFRKAAEEGNPSAQLGLSFMYWRGKGVERDLVMSYAWILVERASGDDKNEKLADHIAKDLQKKLPAAQVVEAQMLASTWWTDHPKGTTMTEYSQKVERPGITKGQKPLLPSAAATPRERNSSEGGLPHNPLAHVSLPPQSGCDTGHWVQSVSDDGSIVKLEDDSVWHISEVDTVDTSLWLPADDVVACEGKLVNTDSGDTVGARQLK